MTRVPTRAPHSLVTHDGGVTTLAPPPPARTARPLRVRLALFAAVTLLAVSNVVSNRLWPEGYLVWNLGMTGVLLVVARLAGVASVAGRYAQVDSYVHNGWSLDHRKLG